MLKHLLNMTPECVDLPYRPLWGHADATILIDNVTKTTRTSNDKKRANGMKCGCVLAALGTRTVRAVTRSDNMNATTLAATTAAALLLAGCSTVLDGFGSASSSASSPVESAKITPAPTGSVESSAVPAAQPAYGAAAATASAAVTPKPSTAANAVALTAPPAATAPGGVAYAEPGAARTQLAGKWTFTWDGGQKSCPVTLSTSQGMSGLAASADLSCPNDIFMTKGWDMWGNEIVLQNHLGKVTARLQPAGGGRFDGVATADGGKITMVRL